MPLYSGFHTDFFVIFKSCAFLKDDVAVPPEHCGHIFCDLIFGPY